MNSGTAVNIEADNRNAFHALAAVGSAKQAGKILSSTPKKSIVTHLMAKDRFGCTPLHLAAYYGHIRLLKTFIDACPEAAEVRDSEGNTARDALQRPNASVLGDPETHQNFQRLVKIDKNGSEYQDFGTGEPMNVWDIAMSSKTSVIVAEPAWKNSNLDARWVFCFIDHKIKQLDIGAHLPRFVATSNVHSLIVTADRCFAWGKNKNGVLGLDTDEKVVLEPRMLDHYFGNDDDENELDANTFSALNRGQRSKPLRDPLIGVACCDFYSCCYSNTKLWCWGTNRGQMLNRVPFGAESLEPELIFEPGNRIRNVVCGDSALFVLTTNGQVNMLSNSKVNRIIWGKTTPNVEAIAGKGEFLVAQTNQGKLMRVKVSPNAEDVVTTVWTPRKPKDNVLTFDVGENGNVIVATKSGVYKVEDNHDILEFKNLKGMPISNIRTDTLCKSSIAVCNINAGLNFADGRAPIKGRFSNPTPRLQWETPPEMSIRACSEDFKVKVHVAVLYARCPLLRPLITHADDHMVAAPGGSSLFMVQDSQKSELLVTHAPEASLQAFAEFLYCADNDSPPPTTLTQPLTAPELHEFHALCRLATQRLGTGLLQARDANISCDVELRSGQMAHLSVLRAGSPVLAAQSQRWAQGPLSISDQSDLESVILQYLYTQSLDDERVPILLIDQAQWLFDLWRLSDALLIPTLSEDCENRLFGMIDFDLVIPFLQETVWSPHLLSSKLYASLLDIIVRYLPYFLPLLAELDGRTIEAVEDMFIKTEGSEPADVELAAAFDTLKTRLSTPVQQAGPKKKNRSTSNGSSSALHSLGRPEFNGASSPTVTVSSSNTSAVISDAELYADSPPKAKASVKLDPKLKQAPLSESSSGWISAKKKTRPSFSMVTEDKTPVKPPVLQRHVGSTTPLASLPSLGSTLNRTNTKSVSSPTSGSTWPPPPLTSRRPPTQPDSLELKPRNAMAAPPVRGGLANLPRLGGSTPSLVGTTALPKLGDNVAPKPRTKSHSKSAKPKFNAKTTMQFDSPFMMAQQLQKKEEPMTPWKSVPKVVRTSPSVLEKLERDHEINNRRLTGGSVWGLRG